MRPRYSKILALCARAEVAAGLTMNWGVTPLVVPFDMINPENTIEDALKELIQKGHVLKGQTVVVIGSILVGDQIVDAVQMRNV
jgi:pyruvate kinase